MSSTSIATIAIAAYAAVVSTLSLFLARRAYQVGGPVVKLGWQYFEPTQDLSITVTNIGRGDVTIADLELYIVRSQITHRSGSVSTQRKR